MPGRCQERMSSKTSAFRSAQHPAHEALLDAFALQQAELEELRAAAVGRAPRRRHLEWLAAAAIGALLLGGVFCALHVLELSSRRTYFARIQAGTVPLRPEGGRERCVLRFDRRPSSSPYPHASVSCGVNLFDAEVNDLGVQLVDDHTDDGDGTLRVDFENGLVELDGAVFVMERGDEMPSREMQARLAHEHRASPQ